MNNSQRIALLSHLLAKDGAVPNDGRTEIVGLEELDQHQGDERHRHCFLNVAAEFKAHIKRPRLITVDQRSQTTINMTTAE